MQHVRWVTSECVRSDLGHLWDVIGTGENRTGVILEGEAGETNTSPPGTRPLWRTRAPMIITFSVPSSSVMDFARNPNATVGLALCPTMAATNKFADKLGYDLTVFRTQLTDEERVFVLAQPPVVGIAMTDASTSTSTSVGGFATCHWQENAEEQVSGSSETPDGRSIDVHVQMNDEMSTVRTFTVRINVADPSARAVLADVQTVPIVSATGSSGGTRCLDACVRIGTHTFPVQFPLPVDVRRAKLCAARRLSYVEVVVPPASFDVRPERDLSSRFASLSLAPNDDGTPTLGSIHRINLDRCPAFKLPKIIAPFNWYDLHLSLAFSELEKERTLHVTQSAAGAHASTRTPPDTFHELKRTLHLLLRSAAGSTRTPHKQAPENVFALFDTERGTPYLYIIVACMRLDVGSHTVVADAFVAHATPAMRAALDMALCTESIMMGVGNLQDPAIRYIKTDGDETAAWFYLIPRLTERCRTWSHKATCVYRQGTSNRRDKGEQASRGLWEGQTPLCTCGAGVSTEILPKYFEPVAPYFTRAAFSPLFPVPYLKEVDVPVGVQAKAEMPLNSKNVASSPGRNLEGGKMDVKKGGAVAYRCRSCDQEGDLTCSRCKHARYCSKACQRADWKVHKKECVKH